MRQYLMRGVVGGALFGLLVILAGLIIDYPANQLFTFFWKPGLFVGSYVAYDVMEIEGPDLAGVEVQLPVALLTHFLLYSLLGVAVGGVLHKIKRGRSFGG